MNVYILSVKTAVEINTIPTCWCNCNETASITVLTGPTFNVWFSALFVKNLKAYSRSILKQELNSLQNTCNVFEIKPHLIFPDLMETTILEVI